MRRRATRKRKKKLYELAFYPAGDYTWTVPPDCKRVDVFLVGGGGAGVSSNGGGGGYTKTFKDDFNGWRDGWGIDVTPGQVIPIRVGAGGKYKDVPMREGYWPLFGEEVQAGSSWFLNENYKAEGGWCGAWRNYYSWDYAPGNGGSGGAAEGGDKEKAGIDGGDNQNTINVVKNGKGQGHTTRDFGEATGDRNAGGGGTASYLQTWKLSHEEGRGGHTFRNGGGANVTFYGGEGYGGGGAQITYSNAVNEDGEILQAGDGGDGIVRIRYWAY